MTACFPVCEAGGAYRAAGVGAGYRSAHEREVDERGRGLAALEDAKPLVHGVEELGVARQALRRAQEEEAAAPQGIVEQGHQLRLQLRVQIDQQVATGDEVDVRERRVADQAVLREDAHLPHFLADLDGGVDPREEAGESFG